MLQKESCLPWTGPQICYSPRTCGVVFVRWGCRKAPLGARGLVNPETYASRCTTWVPAGSGAGEGPLPGGRPSLVPSRGRRGEGPLLCVRPVPEAPLPRPYHGPEAPSLQACGFPCKSGDTNVQTRADTEHRLRGAQLGGRELGKWQNRSQHGPGGGRWASKSGTRPSHHLRIPHPHEGDDEPGANPYRPLETWGSVLSLELSAVSPDNSG